MSNPAANPQHEPTMEEILASIRKIISDDQPEPTKAAEQPAAQPAAAPEVEAEAAPAAAETDVMVLTEEVKDEEPAPTGSAVAVAPAENDIAFETIEVSSNAPETADDDPEDLISNSTRTAVGRAFANMDKTPMEFVPTSGGSIESIFVQAVQGAFQPTLKEWIEGNRTDIMEALKPLIRAWMDEHLPPLIEAAVAKEIGRAAASSRKR